MVIKTNNNKKYICSSYNRKNKRNSIITHDRRCLLRSDKQVNFSSSIQSPMSCFGRGRTTSALVFIEHAMPSDLTNDGQWKNNITTFPLISSYFIEMLKKGMKENATFS